MAIRRILRPLLWILPLLAIGLPISSASWATGTDPYRNFLRDQLERDRFQVKGLRVQIDVLGKRLATAKKAGDRFSQTDSKKELRRIYPQESRLTARVEANQQLLKEYAESKADTATATARTDQENRASLAGIMKAAREERAAAEAEARAAEKAAEKARAKRRADPNHKESEAEKPVRNNAFNKRMSVIGFKLSLARAALATCTHCKGAKFGGAQSQKDLEIIEESTLNEANAQFPNPPADDSETAASTEKPAAKKSASKPKTTKGGAIKAAPNPPADGQTPGESDLPL